MGHIEDDLDSGLREMRFQKSMMRTAEVRPVTPVEQLALEVVAELERAESTHAPMHSPHEGWSVIWEELEELREHVRADTGRSRAARKEALQIAAMGMRYALNLCDQSS
ncbi:hypothetical protein [Pontitalea aquivivens]|uniref:hypothetical protein n=1 Tax=Pontitalea aquivivens TaxID=3388663 RepID=UPI003971126F